MRTKMILLLLVLACRAGHLSAADGEAPWSADDEMEADLTEISIEELMQVNVTTVEGRPSTVIKTPSAITVLTGDDIRRSGHEHLGDMFRLVPGFSVARINGNVWSVGARGFTGQYANKLLVLKDGRSIYTPFYAGVYWECQDVIPEDLDRLEVIRGPGATLWGANAVNGIVNITTKPAEDTQGLLVSAGGGTEDLALVSARYGGRLSDRIHYRLYTRYSYRDRMHNGEAGGRLADDWQLLTGGFRMDGRADGDISWTCQSEAYHSNDMGRATEVFMQEARDHGHVRGAHGMFRLEQGAAKSHGWRMQSYYDYNKMDYPWATEERHVWDVDLRHHFTLGECNALIWGLGVRGTTDTLGRTTTLVPDPTQRTLTTVNGFIQDTFTLVPDKVKFVVGTKVGHNDYSGFEYQPSIRGIWSPSGQHSIWAAVSRPVRTPDRFSRDVTLVIIPSVYEIPRSSDMDSEKVLAYEVGYRTCLHKNVNFDVAAYFNDYDDIHSAGRANQNQMSGDAFGVEVTANWQVLPRWRLRSIYTWQEMHLYEYAGIKEKRFPRHQANLQSYVDVTDDLELNGLLYYVNNIPGTSTPSYTRLDAGLTWRPTKTIEASLWGRNLLESKHWEGLNDNQDKRSEIKRSVFAKVVFRF